MQSVDHSGLLMSLSGIVLGILLAVADYQVSWAPAVSLVITAALIHLYMLKGSKGYLAASVAGAVLTVYLSYGKLFLLESLILLLFGYFIIRLAKGILGSGRFADGLLTCLLKGPIALFGAYFVCTHAFPFWFVLFPALSVGLLCAAAEGTADGYEKGVITVLVAAGISMMTAFSFLRVLSPSHFLYLLAVPAFVFLIARMYMKKEQALDTYRPILALCIFAVAVLTGVGFIGYLF